MSLTVKEYLDIFGWRGVRIALLSWLSEITGRPSEIRVSIKGARSLVRLRPRTTDAMVYRQIFVERTHVVQTARSPRCIIDAGAYIGLSSVDFAMRFPQAMIIAIEPEPEHFRLLVRNTKSFANVVAIQAALWKEKTRLRLFDPGYGAWALQTLAPESDRPEAPVVPTITIDGIMADYGLDFIDMLKLDIEGSEKEVLESSSRWIDRVGILIVEMHDHLREGCSRAFEGVAGNFEYLATSGDKHVCMRREFAPH